MKDNSRPRFRFVKEVNQTTIGEETIYYTEALDDVADIYDFVPGSLSSKQDVAKEYFDDLVNNMQKKTVEIIETSKD